MNQTPPKVPYIRKSMWTLMANDWKRHVHQVLQNRKPQRPDFVDRILSQAFTQFKAEGITGREEIGKEIEAMGKRIKGLGTRVQEGKPIRFGHTEY